MNQLATQHRPSSSSLGAARLPPRCLSFSSLAEPSGRQFSARVTEVVGLYHRQRCGVADALEAMLQPRAMVFVICHGARSFYTSLTAPHCAAGVLYA